MLVGPFTYWGIIPYELGTPSTKHIQQIEDGTTSEQGQIHSSCFFQSTQSW